MAEWAWQVGLVLFSAGVGWGGSKAALNGTKKKVDALTEWKDDVVDRLARIETKIDLAMRDK